jgi:hypothetical protein
LLPWSSTYRAVYSSHSATSTVSIAERLPRAPGWQQAGGGHDARTSRRSKPKYLFFLSFQSGLHEACGAKGVNFFFLFRMFFLNITGFSLVCRGLKYFFWLLSCGLHSTGFVLLRFFLDLSYLLLNVPLEHFRMFL